MSLLSYKLKKKKMDKTAQGSLIALVLAGAIGTILVSSLTNWYLSMKNNIDNTGEKMELASIAMSEWQRLEHMSLDELEENRETYKTPFEVGDKHKVKVELGQQGYFTNGKCNALEGEYATESPNCMQDTILSIYDKETDKLLYTSKKLPLSSVASESGTYNQRLTISEDQTFTAPEKGWYKITSIGGGGGGGGGSCMRASGWMWVTGGGGGGEGGKYIGYHYLKKGEPINITIGKGGNGAPTGCTDYAGRGCGTKGENGNNTIVEINGTSYIAYGGGLGIGNDMIGIGGEGGTGTIKGANGKQGASFLDYVGGAASSLSGLGGGNGYGEGGEGGTSSYDGGTCTFLSGGKDGKNGVVFIEYYSKKAK